MLTNIWDFHGIGTVYFSVVTTQPFSKQFARATTNGSATEPLKALLLANHRLKVPDFKYRLDELQFLRAWRYKYLLPILLTPSRQVIAV